MRTVRAVCVVAALAAGCAALPGAAAALDPPVASCNGGGCGGWFRSAVAVAWSYNSSGVTGTTGCGAASVSDDTGGATFTCTVNYGGSFVGSSVTVRKDSTPPGVTGSAARGPDSNGWYTSPVSFGFKGEDGASGVASCTSGTYGGPDSGSAAATGSCTDNAGNTGSATLTFKYDATPPTVVGVPSRQPDANGWYNHPVDVTFRGNDGGSGVIECSPAVRYAGPDASPAKLVGQCRDAAGHLSAPTTVDLRYDASPPARPNVTWVHRGRSIALSWTRGKDVVRAKVVRAPGPKRAKPGIVYQGKARRLVDRRIRPGTRYWYQVVLIDRAGNEAAKTIGLRPATGIYVPAEGSIVGKPPLVQWSPVAKARFYNLQLWRGNLKLLTTWVTHPRVALRGQWSFRGQRHSLANGSYRLYVWPAFGTRRNPRYGKLLDQVSFVVRLQ
ncbi:MAG: hypothetical protein M5U27_01670 [Gaiella sp.]|nr:hypothetical protein [Gaiella sp.]